MKWNSRIITLLISLSFLVINCEKDKNDNCLIVQTKITQGSTIGYINYSYDSQNRLTKIDWGDGLYTTYSYSSSQVTEQEYTNSQLFSTKIYTLNSNGYATSATYTKASASTAECITTYEYDYDGYLEHEITNKVADANDIDETWYYYYEGNLTEIEREHTKTDYEYYSYTEYEYYTDKLNKKTYELGFLGKLNTNLVKTASITINDGDPINTLYTYETDADGSITKMTTTIGTSLSVMEPSYNCD